MRSVKRSVVAALNEQEEKHLELRQKEQKVRFFMRIFEVFVGSVAVAGSAFAEWAAIVAYQTFQDQRMAIELAKHSFDLQREEFARQAELNRFQTALSKRTLVALSLDTVRRAQGTAAQGINIGQIEAIESLAELAPSALRSLDLSDMYLAGIDLSGTEADLFGVKLCGSDLRNANLNSVKLQHANLTGANLINANLIDTDLQDANLECAQLDHWTVYFDDNPVENPISLARMELCTAWMSSEELAFMKDLVVSSGKVNVLGEAIDKDFLAKIVKTTNDKWERLKADESEFREAQGWKTWGDKPPSCCSSAAKILPSTVPPRSLPWRAKVQTSNDYLEFANLGNGVVETSGFIALPRSSSILKQRKGYLINDDGEPNACKPY